MNKHLAGIPWYSEEDYGEVIELMRDGHLFPSTYGEWQALTERMEERLRLEGKTPVRVRLSPLTFKAWCDARGLNIDAHARKHFASDAMKNVNMG